MSAADTGSGNAHAGRGALVGLAAALGTVFVAMLLAGLATSVGTGSDWYAELPKPFWTPPGWVFGPVWTVLYTLMGIAAWLVWRRAGWSGARRALVLFGLQLLLNVLWPLLFFTLHLTGWAALELVVLLLAILATARAFLRHSRAAAALLLPYAVWVGYAVSINAGVWLMQPGGQ